MKIQAGPDRAKAPAAARSGLRTNLLQIGSETFTNPPVYPGFSMTTCIDTVEIYYPLSQYEARYVSYQLDALTHATDDGPRTRFLSTNPYDEDSNVLVYERFYRFIPGITRIKLVKIRQKWIIKQEIYSFKIFFWLKPELLITGRYSLQLLRCSPANFFALQAAWASAIWRLFPRCFDYAPLDPQLEAYPEGLPPSGAYVNQNLSRLNQLGLCRIERLDVSCDIKVPDAALFEELAMKSFQNGRQLEQKEKPYLLAESPSRAIKAYDKQKEIREQHTRSPNLEELLHQAESVIRIEYSIKKPDRETLRSLFGLTIPAAPRSSPAYIQCGLIPFLFDDGYGDLLLLKVLQEHIGTDAWQSKYHIADAIKNSRLWPGTKKLAEDVAYVISRKRNLNEGRAAYIAGVDIHGRKIQGTAEEFDKGLKALRKLGLNPFRIPGRRNISRLEADYRKYPTVNVGPNYLPRNRLGISSAQAEIYQFVKTKLIKIYKSYKPP